MNIRVTAQSRDGWNAFAARCGVSLSALVEVIGERVSEPDFELSPAFASLVAEARALDAARRQRRSTP